MNVRLILFIFLIPSWLLAQVQETKEPRSWSLAEELPISEINIDTLDVLALRADGEASDKLGGTYTVGREVPFRANPATAGRWFTDSNGNRYWRLRISVPDAQAISVLFSRIILPRGSELYAYSADRTIRRGAFTHRNNTRAGWTIAPLRTNEVVLEYWAPARVTDRPVIDISGIGFFYRGFEVKSTRDYGDAGACQVNVECAEGDNFADARNAVVRILIKSGPFFGFCTGSLINTTQAGCDPYVLSADHCANNVSSADFEQWTFYFNYQGPGCSDPGSDVGLDQETMVGCSPLARTGVGDISSGSDFLLLELNGFVPTAYGAYFAGWSRSVSTPGVCIHHPAGDLKKISTHIAPPQTTTWPGSTTSNRHWLVNWMATANGHGTTEGGSSGAPLVNDQGLIYGMLSGGFSSCDDLTGADFFGKFSTAWEDDGTTNDLQLKPWLDPLGLNLTTLPGTYPPCESASLDEVVERWTIYPNPAVGRIHIELPFLAQSIRVVDYVGKVVYEKLKPESVLTIETDHWPAGAYIVQVQYRDSWTARPVVVQ